MRFTAASLAIVAGTALAIPQAQETVYSTKAVTITSCAPDVPDCSGEDGAVVTQTSTVDCEETPVWQTEYVTVTNCDSEDCTSIPSVPTEVPIVPIPPVSEVPVVPQPQPSDVQPEQPEEPEQPSVPVVPVPQEPITSTVTYSTCIPTVTSSIVIITPSAVPTGSGVPSIPVPVIPTGTGVVPPAPENPTGAPNPPSPSGPPEFDSAAAATGFSLFAGVAALAAFFL